MGWNRQDLIEWLILPFNQGEGRTEAWRRSHPDCPLCEITNCPDVRAANETPLGLFIADCSNFWSHFQYRQIKNLVLAALWKRDRNRRTGAILNRQAPVFIYIPSEGRCLQASQIIKLARERGCSVNKLRGLSIPKLSREEAIAQYNAGQITESCLASFLGVNRLEARRIVQEVEQ